MKKKNKFRILIDYGASEGMKFWDLPGEKGFDRLDDAVKEAIANVYGNDFYIVKIIDWKAAESDVSQL